jgi:diaminopimelate epimerase
MGAPIFTPSAIPFNVNTKQHLYNLRLDQQIINISAVSMGNPHAVTIVENVDTANVYELGPKIESHEQFPERVNAGFMQILNSHEIKLRVYERGSGETLSCGTGACAAVVCGIQLGLLESPVMVNTRGGQLQIDWQGNDSQVIMIGPAEIVFEGEIEI